MPQSPNSIKKIRRISNVLIVVGVLLVALSLGPLIKDEIWFFLKEAKSQQYFLAGAEVEEGVEDSVFSRFLSASPVVIDPVNKGFSVVIEKIGVNAPIIADVPVTDEKAYTDALKSGVAHAITSRYPSEKPGNVYLFAHSSVNFWQLGKYASVFNLVRKLDIGDRIHVFYEGKDYVYETVNSEVYKGWNTYPLTRVTIEPTLTIQTCDPPGTTLNRLVVTAKLVDVIEE